MIKRLQLKARTQRDGITFMVKGRDAWALQELISAGPRGCTPIDHPGPRWSAYVFNLKRDHGLNIETRHEAHKGNFPGTHARYVLLDDVEIITPPHEPQSIAA
jgi:hypothetical protein